MISPRLAAFGETLLGKPKGVMLSHLNIVSATLACTNQLGQYAPNSQVGWTCPDYSLPYFHWFQWFLRPMFPQLICFQTFLCILQDILFSFLPLAHLYVLQDILFSFLPLAHTLERCCELSVFMAGGAVGFYSGNLKTLTADMKALKPTILPAVPRCAWNFCSVSVFLLG